ncbi:MAG: galactitol-1-phosphate 5-dehydrogenase [Deltaproteobacteria bacterium]|nr:galactitol-1-phosphate 5-dehydrogenase [Deltaproteobacteria bacterium]
MKTMKAAVLNAIQKWEYREMAIPECGPDDFLLQTKVSGICVTDVLRSMKTGFYHYPIVPGHEFCGVVYETGRNVTTLKKGDRVAVYPLIPCKQCGPCLGQNYNLCNNYNFLGSRTHGGHAEYVLCPAENAVKLPDAVTFEQAALAEPLSVGLHACKRAGFSGTIDRVVIMGIGPIGMMIAFWAKHFGAKEVIGFARNEFRLEMARRLGIDHVVDTRLKEPVDYMNTLTGKEGATLVFECSGSNELQPQAIQMAAKRGKVVIVGNPSHSLKINKDVYDILLRREITIVPSWSSLIAPENEWAESLNYVADGKIDPAKIITHKFNISEVGSVMERMYFKKFDFFKVVFHF